MRTCLEHALKISAILFVLSMVFERTIGAWRYLYWTALPLSVIFLMLCRNYGVVPGNVKKAFLEFIKPFIPVVIGILAIYLFHQVGEKNLGFNSFGIIRVIFISALLYACLMCIPRITPRAFFIATSVMSFYSLADIYLLAVAHHCTIFDVRYFIDPQATIYGRILSLTGGLSFLGFFYCKDESKRYRLFFLISGLIGIAIPVFLLYVRSVVLTGVFVLISALLLSKIKIKWSVVVPAMIAIFAVSVSVGPIKDRFTNAYRDTVAVVQTNAANTCLDALEAGTDIPDDKRKLLLNNLGTRIAMWEMAWRDFKSSPLVGTGISSPRVRYDLKTLFKETPYYWGLKHYHSDYLVALAAGGLVFFLGLILTQLMLLKEAFRDPIKLFLLLSVISYGLVDLGFLLKSSFTIFIGAWVVLSTWNTEKHTTKTV